MQDVKNSESLGLGMLGKGIAKLARLKPDPYVNMLLGGVPAMHVESCCQWILNVCESSYQMYVVGHKLATTSTVDDTLDPEWEEVFLFSVCHKQVEDLVFEVCFTV